MKSPIKHLTVFWRATAIATSAALVSVASADFNTLEVWGNAADGPAALTGSGSGPYEILGGGADFWGGSDQGVWAWNDGGEYTTTSDFTAVVRHVSTTTPAPEWGRDGILVRATQTPGTPSATDANFLSFRKSNGAAEAGVRGVAGGGTDLGMNVFDLAQINTGNVATTPFHFAAARHGNTMRAGAAMDFGGGLTGRWVQMGAHTSDAFNSGNEVIVGLGHQSHPQTISPDSNDFNTATFDSWSYSDTFNSSFFGPAADPATWQVDGSLDVNPLNGLVRGSAFVRSDHHLAPGGIATGENTAWSISALRTDNFVPAFGVAASRKDPTAMEAADIVPSSHFRLNDMSAAGSGLTADIYLAANPGNQAGVRNIINMNAPNGTAIIPNVDWTGGSDNDANYYGLTGPASFAVAVQGVDPADGTSGAFSGNQDNYGVHITGEIFIPSDDDRQNHPSGGEWIQFEDGIDDYTFLAVDGVVLLDDNDWTGRNSVDNGGGHIALFDASDDKFNEGAWVSFEMIMWEGGGGDAGVLYWDAFDANNTFDPNQTPRGFDIETVSGINQVGSELMSGDFGLDLPAGDWEVTLTNRNTGALFETTQMITVIPEPGVLATISLAGLAFIFRRRRHLR